VTLSDQACDVKPVLSSAQANIKFSKNVTGITTLSFKKPSQALISMILLGNFFWFSDSFYHNNPHYLS
jgi:hypothetical protein